MTTTMEAALEAARAKLECDKVFGKAFRAELFTYKPLGLEIFWDILDRLAYRCKQDRNVKAACHNLFFDYVYSGEDDLMPSNWQKMAAFLARYEQVSILLSRKMADWASLDRGGDGYGDLMDSLPLAGKAVFDGIMEDDIANNKQLEKAMAESPLKDFILHGENYIKMTYEASLMKAFLAVARRDDSE